MSDAVRRHDGFHWCVAACRFCTDDRRARGLASAARGWRCIDGAAEPHTLLPTRTRPSDACCEQELMRQRCANSRTATGHISWSGPRGQARACRDVSARQRRTPGEHRDGGQGIARRTCCSRHALCSPVNLPPGALSSPRVGHRKRTCCRRDVQETYLTSTRPSSVPRPAWTTDALKLPGHIADATPVSRCRPCQHPYAVDPVNSPPSMALQQQRCPASRNEPYTEHESCADRGLSVERISDCLLSGIRGHWAYSGLHRSSLSAAAPILRIGTVSETHR